MDVCGGTCVCDWGWGKMQSTKNESTTKKKQIGKNNQKKIKDKKKQHQNQRII
jgi:hypothetical protein